MREKGLTGFQLKLLGLILMVFDHIHEFFSYTGSIPIAFNWIGRIVAPIFLFMAIEGYTHTRSKKKYMSRLFLGFVIMNIGNYILPRYFERPDNLGIMNNIFSTLFMITVYLCIIDYIYKAKKEKNTLKIFFGILLLTAPIALAALFIIGANSGNTAFSYLALIIPTPVFVEGGPVFVVLGILMYLLRKDRRKLIAGYIVISLSFMFTGELSISGLFFNNYQWMMVFAAPLFYLYNGQKGRGLKYLFYVFYPAHIYVLYVISCLMMNS